MADSIKKQCIARIMANLQGLATAGTVRVVARKTTLLGDEGMKPAIHVVIGEEERVGDGGGEDHRGYTMIFPVAIKIMVSDQRDPYGKLDDLEGEVQKVIEADLQLNQLADEILFDGVTPFTNEVQKPEGGTIVFYAVQYRRERAKPDVKY